MSRQDVSRFKTAAADEERYAAQYYDSPWYVGAAEISGLNERIHVLHAAYYGTGKETTPELDRWKRQWDAWRQDHAWPHQRAGATPRIEFEQFARQYNVYLEALQAEGLAADLEPWDIKIHKDEEEDLLREGMTTMKFLAVAVVAIAAVWALRKV